MVRKQGNLTVEENGNKLDIDNGRVRLRLYFRDGGYVQEFQARDRAGIFQPVLSSLHKNLIPASEHRVCTSPMIAGERPHLFGVCRESLRMVYSTATVIEHSQDCVKVRLSGTVQGHTINCNITLAENAEHFHIAVDDTIASEDDTPLVEYLMSAFAFLPGEWAVTNSRPLDYTWAPILRPRKDHVIGDLTFGTPAIIVQHSVFSAALIPDLRVLELNRPLPAVLDLDIANGLLFAPLLSYGLCGYELVQNGCFCRHDVTMSRRLDPPRLSYAYSILISADCKRKSAHSHVSRFLWNTYGSSAIRQQPPCEYPVIGALERPGAIPADAHTQMPYRTGLDILKLAQDALTLYESTRSRAHLDKALHAIDEACLMQSVWNLPWSDATVPAGALSASNLGCRPDPELTAEFARVAMRCGELTGEKYYFERGTAALIAALSAAKLDTDARAHVDECVDSIKSRYGSVYIHLGRKWGACTAGARIRKLDFTKNGVSLDFLPHSNGNGHRRIVFGGLRARSYTISIDGVPKVFTREQMQAGLIIQS